MALVSEVVSEMRRKYPACDPTRALELFNKVYREFATRSQIRNSTLSITLTASTAEYDLSSAVYMIHEAYYEESSNPSDWTPLKERSLDEYITKRWGWRQTQGSSSKPVEYYTTSAENSNTSKARVGFWPVPDTSTSGTYPRVRLYVTTIIDLITSDTVPPQVVNTNLFVYGMYALWAADKVPADLAYNEALATREMEKNVQHVKNLQVNLSTERLSLPTLTRSRVT